MTLLELVSKPVIDWHPIDERVRLLYVPSADERHIPDGDILFATAWNTARPVMGCRSAKGEKCYLIQHYETFLGPRELVDETWRLPLRKVVIAQWLLDLGINLGADSLNYVPNGIDHKRYHATQPIERRPRQVAMMCSHVEFKGSKDGIAALQIAKIKFPDLRVVLFGNSYRPPWVPEWMSYAENPPQQLIIEQLYNGSSIMLSPSLAEGFGLPPAEAAPAGAQLSRPTSAAITSSLKTASQAYFHLPRILRPWHATFVSFSRTTNLEYGWHGPPTISSKTLRGNAAQTCWRALCYKR